MRVTLDGVSVEVAGSSLVRELRLGVGSGEVVGLVGPNGSGKSTALRCVYRALTPTRGTVLLDGTDVRALSLRENATRVAALTQEAGSDLDFTVAEVVAMGRSPHVRGNQALDARERELCERAMDHVDITHLAGRSLLTLSGGERQRTFVARALVQEPQVLVFDEPTNHLDPRHQVELLSLLRSCGLTVLVALHDLNLAAMACDRLGVLAAGALVATGTPTEVLTPELVLDVFELPVTVVPHPATGVPQLLYTLTDTRTDDDSGFPAHPQLRMEGTR